MSEQLNNPDADPQSNQVHVEIDDGAMNVDFSKDRLSTMSKDEKRATARALAGLAVGRALRPEELTSLESLRPTMSASAEDGATEQFTALGGGVAAQEHIPNQH